MDMPTYLKISEATLANGKFFSKLVDPEWFRSLIAQRLELNKLIDGTKKALFYGRERLEVRANITRAMPIRDVNLLHAVLGIDTESAELLELLIHRKDYTQEEFRLKIIDEGGDLLWYLALLFRENGVTFEEAAEKNIAKLQARYPEGFTTFAALHRNESKETAALL